MNTNQLVDYAEYVSWTRINDEVFVFDERTDEICIYKGAKKVVWLLVEECTTIGEILDRGARQENITEEHILKALAFFANNHLIVLEKKHEAGTFI